MNYTKVDLNTWHRAEYFEHYRQTQCTYSICIDLDISNLIRFLDQTEYKFYPTIIHLISTVINIDMPEFRMALKNDELVIWDEIHPAYTIFHPDHQTFSAIWTEYDKELSLFIKSFNRDFMQYKSDRKLFPKPNLPENHFNISAVPWVNFTGFNLNLPKLNDYFLPIFTLGKYKMCDGKTLLPISIQVHHAVCDGFHVAKFVEKLQNRLTQHS